VRVLENDDSEWEKTYWRSCWYKFLYANTHGFSKRCGIIIDGEYIERQSGHEKIIYKCSCVEKETQDIVWGFMLSERPEDIPENKVRETAPPTQHSLWPPLKLVMERQDHRDRIGIEIPEQNFADDNTKNQIQESGDDSVAEFGRAIVISEPELLSLAKSSPETVGSGGSKHHQ